MRENVTYKTSGVTQDELISSPKETVPVCSLQASSNGIFSISQETNRE